MQCKYNISINYFFKYFFAGLLKDYYCFGYLTTEEQHETVVMVNYSVGVSRSICIDHESPGTAEERAGISEEEDHSCPRVVGIVGCLGRELQRHLWDRIQETDSEL